MPKRVILENSSAVDGRFSSSWLCWSCCDSVISTDGLHSCQQPEISANSIGVQGREDITLKCKVIAGRGGLGLIFEKPFFEKGVPLIHVWIFIKISISSTRNPSKECSILHFPLFYTVWKFIILHHSLIKLQFSIFISCRPHSYLRVALLHCSSSTRPYSPK